MHNYSLKRRVVALGAIAAAVVLPVAQGGAAYAAPPSVTLASADASTGSSTQTAPGSTINHVASVADATGQATLTSTIPAGQSLVAGSVSVPTGWTNNSSGNQLSVTGDLGSAPAGTFTASTTDIALATVNTTTTGGDGYVPVPHGSKVFGAYHYTLDGYNGGAKLLWSADKETGHIDQYSLGMGSTFLTPWLANPTVVGSKLFIPGYKFASTPVMNGMSSPDYGFGCFDMDARAACSTKFYKIGTAGQLQTILSKGTSAIRTQPISAAAGLGTASNGLFYMTAIESAGAAPVVKAIDFSSGAPVVTSTATMNTKSTMWMENITADGSKLFSTDSGNGSLYCTDTATGAACAGWVTPTNSVPSGGSSRISMIDGANLVCVEDTQGASHVTNCYDTATGALTSPSPLSGVQNIGGPQFRTDSTGTREYFGPGYTSSPTILCLDGGAPCADFGTAGVAPVVGGVTDFKTYGVAADDLLPSCMWVIGDAGQLYPFDATTGAAGCDGATASVPVAPDASQWCGDGGVKGFSTLTFAGTAPTGTVHVKAVKDGMVVPGWEDKALPAGASVDISALPYVAGSVYDIVVTFDGAALLTTDVTVTMDQDPIQVCFDTVVDDDCAVASPATNTVNLAVGNTNAASNTTSLDVVLDPVKCPAGNPGITIVKKINGDDANTAPGVNVTPGSTMAITYEVTNDGNVALTNVTVTDDKVASADITCPKTTLAAGEGMTCTASLAAPAPGVQHTNVGSVEGTDPDGGKVSDTDPANASVAANPDISIVKKINGDDANTAPGVTVPAGSTMAITYEVQNTGNVALSGVAVTDDKVVAADITCPKATLAPGESMECTASLAAPAAGVQHTNTGSVEGTSPQNVRVTDSDPANANVASVPAITIVKKINGSDANTAPGVTVPAGSTMAITYEVTNNGNVALSDVAVTDDKVAASAITCPKATLTVGESMTCTASLPAPAAGVQHTNVGTVEGTDPDGGTVRDTDPANANVTPAPGITIVKTINGDDANTAPGVTVPAGSTMAIAYVVTNSGNVALTNVTVTDDKVAAADITCPKATLAPGESMTCTASLVAPAAGVQHTNVGTVEGTDPDGGKVGDTDPANASVAANPAISIVKKINGDDANTAPGVKVEAGSVMNITYDVTNTGNTYLSAVTVSDDKVEYDTIKCPKQENFLAPGETIHCTATLLAPAVGVQHTNTATTAGWPADKDGNSLVGLDRVTDTDPANAYVAAAPAIHVVKSINGDDANEAPGVTVEAGSTMAITYTVTNVGNVALTDVTVTDDKVAASAITCPKATLAPGESMTCTASLVAPAAGVQHTNVGKATGKDPSGTLVTDEDPANAKGKSSGSGGAAGEGIAAGVPAASLTGIMFGLLMAAAGAGMLAARRRNQA